MFKLSHTTVFLKIKHYFEQTYLKKSIENLLSEEFRGIDFFNKKWDEGPSY